MTDTLHLFWLTMDRRSSVLTLVRDRGRHLEKVVDALQLQECPPAQLVVASMQAEPPDIPQDVGFPVSILTVAGEKLPLAAARNRCAKAATSDHLIFLDVDCIPSRQLVRSYQQALEHFDGCLIGEVRYLPQMSIRRVDTFEALLSRAKRHPSRPAMPDTAWCLEPEARALWGLSFALRRATFLKVGGFDERFVGYGGEETDFAERLRCADIPLAWCADAMALHQNHVIHSPPLNHFDDIVRNATLFYETWGSWCMEYWLDQFASMGLIDWSEQSNRIRISRRPTSTEVDQSRKPSTALWG